MTPPTTKPDGRTKPRPGVDHQRAHIAQTAVALFAEHGTASVSIAKICRAADVSKPTFYRCFTDKDALVAHVYDETIQQPVAAHMVRLLSPADGDTARTRQSLALLAEGVFEQADAARLLFRESADTASPAHRIVSDAYDEACDAVERFYGKHGLTPPTRTTMRATMAACQWILHDAITRGLTPTAREDAVEAMWQISERVFRR